MSSLWASVTLESVLHTSKDSTTCASSTLRAFAIQVTDPHSDSPTAGISIRFISTDLMLGASMGISARCVFVFHLAYLFPTALRIYPWLLDSQICLLEPSSLGLSKSHGHHWELLHPNLQRHHHMMQLSIM